LNRWLAVARLPFLALSLAVVFLGSAMAWYAGAFNPVYAVLSLLGLMTAHGGVNVLNEYFDFHSGVDFNTEKTPFSGGSGVMPAGLLRPRQALALGTGLLGIALAVGIFFVFVRGLWMLPLLLVGAVCILLYNPVILKKGWAEWAPGLGLGSLAILGTYFVQLGSISWPIVFASIPSGILAHNLLLLNEFPDVEADRSAGRVSLPILLGRERALLIYAGLTIGMYLWIITGVSLSSVSMPVYCLLGLLTLPFAVKAIRGARHFHSMQNMVPAMAANVAIVLLTQVLLGVGYILGRTF